MKNIAIVLSGCGHQDGAEVTEAVCSILTLSQLGASLQFFAPDLEVDEVDHIKGRPTGQKRNILIEAARIARGRIKNLESLKSQNFDGLVFPGGRGAAIHLSDFAVKGSKGSLLPEVQRVILDFYKESKPMAAICIAPVLMAFALGTRGVSITIGKDFETAKEIEKLGAKHIECPVDDYVTDRENKIITTPAYMYSEAKPHEIFKGIQGALKELYEMA